MTSNRGRAGSWLEAQASHPAPLLLGFLALLACVIGGLHQTGQDVNFDQLNYHFYSAYAFLHNRMAMDAAPAGLLHSYFNPLPYLPFYWLVQHLSPRRAIFILGAWHGLNFLLVTLIAWRITAAAPLGRRIVLCAGAGAISAASPMAMMEWATSFADITTSLLVLGGVYAFIRAVPDEGSRHGDAWHFAGAFLVGVAAGLKLTNAIYAPGLLACCLTGADKWRARLRATALAGAGGALGIAVSGGPWSWRLWEKFHNPVFPYYNAIFRSHEAGASPRLARRSFFDDRFLPHGIWQAAELPFRWISTNVTTCELSFRDIRFAALVAIVLAWILLAAAIRLAGLPRARILAPDRARQHTVLAFFFLSFAAWAYQFGIQRYIVGLELLTGPAIVAALLLVLPAGGAASASVGIAAISLLTVVVPDFGRIKARQSWYGVQVPAALRQPGLVFLQGDTLSYTVAFLPSASHVVGLIPIDALRSGAGNFADRMVHHILEAQPDIPIFVILNEPLSAQTRRALGSFGLGAAGACANFPTRPEKLAACALRYTGQTDDTELTLRPGETLTFDGSMKYAAALLPGWTLGAAWGVAGAGYNAAIGVRLAPAFGAGPLRVSIGFSRPERGQADGVFHLRVNGRPTQAEVVRSGSIEACVDSGTIGVDELLSVSLGGAPEDLSVGLKSLRVAADPDCRNR